MIPFFFSGRRTEGSEKGFLPPSGTIGLGYGNAGLNKSRRPIPEANRFDHRQTGLEASRTVFPES